MEDTEPFIQALADGLRTELLAKSPEVCLTEENPLVCR